MKESKIKDIICSTVAYLLPKRVLHWCIIRIWARATVKIYPDKTPDEVTWDMAIKTL